MSEQNQSLFENGQFKPKEELLRLYEEAQWKTIMSRLDRSVGNLAPVDFLDTGRLLKKNAQRLKDAGYEVYHAKGHFSVTFVADENNGQ